MAKIESQDLNISKLLSDFYEIPSYQREYVWQREHIDEFFDDIFYEFKDSLQHKEIESNQYFIGSIIVCNTPEGLYELIDGQQRITTIYLLLCAIRDSLRKHDASIQKLNSQIAANDIDSDGNDVFRHRVKLQYTDSCGVIEKLADGKTIEEVPETSSAKNLKSAYDRLKDRILEELGKDRENINKIKKFYAFLSSHVILVRVKTETRMDALKIFATINNRGVNLEPIDLVKNLMFMEANKQEFNRLKKSWKKMVDTLYKHKEKPMRFLRYFVLSQYEDTDSLKGNIYGWLLKSQNKKYYAKEPLSFVKNLIEACNHYTLFTKGKDTKGKENPHIENIRIISNSARLPFMVLLAGTHLSNDLFSQLCKELENIFFVYLLIRERTSSFERKFTDWCATLRQVKSQEDFEEFISSKISTEKAELSSQFENAFLHLTEKSITQSQLRYILAKLTQYINDGSGQNVVTVQ